MKARDSDISEGKTNTGNVRFHMKKGSIIIYREEYSRYAYNIKKRVM